MSQPNFGNAAPVVKFCGEALIPGGSLMMSGDFRSGLAHTAAGVLAQAFLGFPFLLMVKADSFSKAITGRHAYEYLAPPQATEAIEVRES